MYFKYYASILTGLLDFAVNINLESQFKVFCTCINPLPIVSYADNLAKSLDQDQA